MTCRRAATAQQSRADFYGRRYTGMFPGGCCPVLEVGRPTEGHSRTDATSFDGWSVRQLFGYQHRDRNRNAEITVFPWKEPEKLKQRTIDRVCGFLKAHVPMRAAAQ
jgi:hypothetical protein